MLCDFFLNISGTYIVTKTGKNVLLLNCDKRTKGGLRIYIYFGHIRTLKYNTRAIDTSDRQVLFGFSLYTTKDSS